MTFRRPFPIRGPFVAGPALAPSIVPVKVSTDVESHPLVVKVRRFVEQAARAGAAPAVPVATASVSRTHAYFILDASGSMRRDKDVTVVGYNQQVDTVRESAALGGETSVSLLVFADEVGVSYLHQPVSHLVSMTEQSYRPDGNTALMDALGAAIERALDAPGSLESTCAFLFQAFTDGEENASKVCSPEVIARCVQLLETTGRFTFTLIGPREQLNSMADMLSLAKGNVQGCDPTSRLEKAGAFASMQGATSRYFSMRSAGVTASACLYVEPPEGETP